jgi:hypothetical protein
MIITPTPKIVAPTLGEFVMAGVWKGELYRRGRLIDQFEEPNIIVNEGLNNVLDVQFGGSAQADPWYIGVFEGNYTPVATVAAATIAAASTESTAYASATRPEWVDAAAASQSKDNSASRASFVFNATKTIYGAFLVSNNVKSGTAGVLFSAARFASSKAVENLDELLLTYTINAASA